MIHTVLIGAGFQGANLGRALAQRDDVTVDCVVDIDGPRAKRLAEDLGSRVVDFDSVAAAAPDFAVIAVPNNLHTGLARRCLELGMGVFVEKPLGLDRTAIGDVMSAVGQRPLLVGHCLRTVPGIRRLLSIVREGELGGIHEVRGSRTRRLSGSAPVTWKTDPAQSGGELLHELHELDLLCLIGGEVAEVTTFPDLRGEGRQDAASHRLSVLRFASGAIGLHELSRIDHLPRWEISVHGSEGSLRADFRRGLVEHVRSGEIIADWPIFDEPEDNHALIQSARTRPRYNTSAAAPPRWMQRLATNCAAEIARAGRGEHSVLQDRPADAALTALDLLSSESS